MKTLIEFKHLEMPKNLLKFLKGGGQYCDALDGCIATAIRDGNDFLIDDCSATFGAGCLAEQD